MAFFEVASKEAEAPSVARGTEAIWWIACVVAAVGIGLHLIQPATPLWLDETWTAVTSGQKTLPEVIAFIYNDACAPLHYLLIHYWSLLFGTSDEALRLPSVIASALAPLMAFTLDKRANRTLALLWCALAAIWVPGITYSNEARCYALLFLLSMAGTAAYANLLLEPTLKRATIWTSLSTLMVLTHYHAGFLILCQGIGYLLIHRGKALRTWPAAAVFLPALAWILYHAPRMAQFVAPGFAWYPPLSLNDLIVAAGFVGFDIALIAALVKRTEPPSEAADSSDGPLKLDVLKSVFAASAAGAALVLAIALIRPSFTIRYIFPYAPGILFGAAFILYQARERWLRVSVVLSVLLLLALFSLPLHRFHIGKANNWEAASEFLMEDHPTRLVFLWDHPWEKIAGEPRLKGLGGFFFERANQPVDVKVVDLQPGEDPNKALLAKAGNDPKAALLWLYDRTLPAAVDHYPEQIATLDPAWTCHNFGGGPIGIIACSRKAAE